MFDEAIPSILGSEALHLNVSPFLDSPSPEYAGILTSIILFGAILFGIASLLDLIAVGIQVYYSGSKDEAGRHAPWVISSWIFPYLPMVRMGIYGHDFFEQCRQKYGNAYCFRMSDMTPTTFIHDNDFAAATGRAPGLYNMYQAFDKVAYKIFIRNSRGKFQFSGAADVHRNLAKAVGPAKLPMLCNYVQVETARYMAKRFPAAGEWSNLNLREFATHLVFVAVTRALYGNFGPRLESQEFFAKWKSFDDMIPFFGLLLPEIFYRDARKSQEDICNYLADSIPENQQTEIFKLLRKGDDPFGKDQIFIIHWAMNANSGPALFWVLSRILRDHDARAMVLQELYEKLKEEQDWDPKTSTGPPQLDYKLIKKLDLLKSYIKDILRVYSSSWLYRGVTKTHTVTLSTGETIKLQKGENIICTSAHHDEDIFPQADIAKPDRFLPGTVLTNSAGRKVKLPLMTFGHGAYKCPGEHVAFMELSYLVAMLLLEYDLELTNPLAGEPQPDRTRIGFGVMTLDPKFSDHESVSVRLRRKPAYASM